MSVRLFILGPSPLWGNLCWLALMKRQMKWTKIIILWGKRNMKHHFIIIFLIEIYFQLFKIYEKLWNLDIKQAEILSKKS